MFKLNLKAILILLLSTSLFYSCDKGEFFDYDQTGGHGVDTTDIIPPITDDSTTVNNMDLLPMKLGSTWLYVDDSSRYSLMTAMAGDTLVDGESYQYFEMKDTFNGQVTPWYFNKGTQYYKSLVNLAGGAGGAGLPGGGVGMYVPVIISTIDPKVGDQWIKSSEVNLGIGTAEAAISGKVVSVSATVNIDGTTYNNAVITENKISISSSFFPTAINAGTFTLIFVKGVGIATIDINISVMNFINNHSTNNLVQYHIND